MQQQHARALATSIALTVLFSCTPGVALGSAYSDLVLSHSPVAYWRLGEVAGTTANDAAGSHNGMYQNDYSLGQTGAIDGDTDNAVYLDGSSNDRVQVNSFDVNGSGITMVAWFYVNNFDDARFVSKATGTSVSEHWWMLGIEADDRLKCRVKIDGTTRELKPDVSTMSTDEWYFAAATFDGSAIRVYLNGVQVGSSSYSGSVSTSGGVNVGIGNQPSGAGDRGFKGRLDEVAVLDKALTASEIRALFEAGVGSPTLYYVRTDGNDGNSGTGPSAAEAWQTIAAALQKNELVPGDVVYVKTGIYNGKHQPDIDGWIGMPIRFVADRDGSIFGSGGDVVLDGNGENRTLEIKDDDYLSFEGFTIVAGSESAVHCENSLSASLNRIQIYGSGNYGVRVKGSSTATLTNLLVHDRTEHGLYIESGTVDVWNCTLVDNVKDGIRNKGNTTLRNCIIAANNEKGLNQDDGSLVHDYNLVYGNSTNYSGTSQNTNEIVLDPLFLGAGDYHLTSISPAINTGTDATGIVDEDLDDSIRPIGSTWDIGCYEFSLLGEWQFDEGSGSVAFDSSGNGRDGTLKGGAGWKAGRGGYAAALDGAGDWVDLGQLDVNVTTYTLSAWINTSANFAQTIFAATADGTSDHLMYVGLDSDGHIEFVHRSPPAASGGATVTTAETYNDGRWHHVVAVKSTSEIRIYVDGELLDSASDTTGGHSPVDIVAGRYGLNLGQNYFKGSLDEVLLYGTPLSTAEVANLYGLLLHWKLDESSGFLVDDSSSWDRDGLLIGNPLWQILGGLLDGALEFPGFLSRISDGDAEDYLNGLSEITVSLWVKSDVTNVDKGIFFTDDPNGSDELLGMRYDKDGASGGGTALIKYSIETDSGFVQAESSSGVQTTEWQHLALVWKSGETFALYIDGVLDTPTVSGAPPTGSIASTSKLLLGIGTKSQVWDGLIDDVRIYNRALSPEEVVELVSSVLPIGVRIIRWEESKSLLELLP